MELLFIAICGEKKVYKGVLWRKVIKTWKLEIAVKNEKLIPVEHVKVLKKHTG